MSTEFQISFNEELPECSRGSHKVLCDSVALYSCFLAEISEDHQPLTSLPDSAAGQEPRSGHGAQSG